MATIRPASTQPKPLGTVQIDVDDLWVYYESIGLPPPAGVPSQVYEQGIPRLLDLFDRFGMRTTFFVCGRDLPAQASWVAEMVRRGHEVANHSTWHRNGFARLARAEKFDDIATTHVLIHEACGQSPVGFKSPGFSFGADQLAVLSELGYLYDSSLLPTPYAPLLRTVQRALSGGHVDPTHYGRPSHGLAPLRPYLPNPAAPHKARNGRQPGSASQLPMHHSTNLPAAAAYPPTNASAVWEAPVTTVPLLRLPMHSTFVLTAGRPLFDVGLALTRARRVPVNYLLHAADVIDAAPDPALASYRFLAASWADKRPLYEHLLRELSAAYHLVPTADFVQHYQ